jgi:hypothetical protein
MSIEHFRFDTALQDAFVRFGYKFYKADDHWIPPFRKELYAQLSPEFPFYQKPGNSHRHFVVTRRGGVVGRVSAMVNSDLRDKDGTPVGTVGFFECINDYTVAQKLLRSATQWLHDERKINRIWGPMNFDIWYSYRFMTRGFDQKLFYGEPYNPPYYPEFFERFGFVTKQEWDSVEITGREALEKMIVRGKERFKLLVNRGYRFELFNMRRFEDEMRKLYVAMTKSFGGFLGFTPISFEEFKRLFAGSRYAFHPRLFVFAYDETNTLAGFAAAFLELSDAVRSMNGKDSLIAKLKFIYNRKHVNRINFYIGGVTPEEAARKTGLGRAGFYYIINQILNEGFETLLLTLRLKGNFAHGLLGKNAPVPQREYALYELNR